MSYSLARYIAAVPASATEEVDNAVKRMRRAGIRDIISLGVGEPCFDTPPHIVEAAREALLKGETKYQPTAGDYVLREVICAKLHEENQINADVEDVLVTPGAKFAIFLAFQAMLGPGDRVMVLNPAWVSHECIPMIMGAQVVHVNCSESDDYQPDLHLVRKMMDSSVKFVIVNSPCNPTGAVYDRSTIRGIVEIAREHGALVLSDEVYESLVFEGERFSPGSEYDNVITVNGFSKTYAMTGWRLGYVTGPREILDGMIKIYQHSTSCVTAFAQAGAVEALRNPESQRAAKAMVEAYSHKRQLMMTLLTRSGFFQCRGAKGAFYTFPSYSLQKSSVELAQELLERVHVATLPGVAFGECGEHHLRLSYAVADEQLVEAFDRIEHLIGKL